MAVKPSLIVIAGASLTAGALFAQYQVNRAIYSGPNTGSMQYSGQNSVSNPPLPSQNRQQVMQSGMLPSEIRGNAMAAGPMAPGGISAILPTDSQLSRAQGPKPAPTGAMAAPTGSMGYSSVSPSRPVSTELRPSQISGQAPGTGRIDSSIR